MTSWFERENHSRQLPKSAEWTFYLTWRFANGPIVFLEPIASKFVEIE
jgi:hypothetical protein